MYLEKERREEVHFELNPVSSVVTVLNHSSLCLRHKVLLQNSQERLVAPEKVSPIFHFNNFDLKGYSFILSKATW